MTTTAQYASVPRSSVAQVSTANTNRDGTGTLSNIVMASAKALGGMRIDAINIQAVSTTTAGMVRLFVQKGRPGPSVASISFSGTTATVVTDTAHGLTTGQTTTHVGAYPDEYNVDDSAVTVISPTSFSYVMGTAPTTNATVLGSFATSLATPVRRLVKEVPVTAITPSATVQAFNAVLAAGDRGIMPLVLPPGYSLRASTEKAETFNITPTIAGDFA